MGRCHDLTNQCAPPLQIMKYTNEHAVTAGISSPPSTDTHRHKAPRDETHVHSGHRRGGKQLLCLI